MGHELCGDDAASFEETFIACKIKDHKERLIAIVHTIREWRRRAGWNVSLKQMSEKEQVEMQRIDMRERR